MDSWWGSGVVKESSGTIYTTCMPLDELKCVYRCVHLCGSKRSISNVFFSCSLPFFLETGSLTEPGVYQLASVAAQ